MFKILFLISFVAAGITMDNSKEEKDNSKNAVELITQTKHQNREINLASNNQTYLKLNMADSSLINEKQKNTSSIGCLKRLTKSNKVLPEKQYKFPDDWAANLKVEAEKFHSFWKIKKNLVNNEAVRNYIDNVINFDFYGKKLGLQELVKGNYGNAFDNFLQNENNNNFISQAYHKLKGYFDNERKYDIESNTFFQYFRGYVSIQNTGYIPPTDKLEDDLEKASQKLYQRALNGLIMLHWIKPQPILLLNTRTERAYQIINLALTGKFAVNSLSSHKLTEYNELARSGQYAPASPLEERLVNLIERIYNVKKIINKTKDYRKKIESRYKSGTKWNNIGELYQCIYGSDLPSDMNELYKGNQTWNTEYVEFCRELANGLADELVTCKKLSVNKGWLLCLDWCSFIGGGMAAWYVKTQEDAKKTQEKQDDSTFNFSSLVPVVAGFSAIAGFFKVAPCIINTICCSKKLPSDYSEEEIKIQSHLIAIYTLANNVHIVNNDYEIQEKTNCLKKILSCCCKKRNKEYELNTKLKPLIKQLRKQIINYENVDYLEVALSQLVNPSKLFIN